MSNKDLVILVADDEPHARRTIQLLVDASGIDAKLIQAGSASETIRHLDGEMIDIAFLDIELGDATAFDALAATGAATLPVIVFVTAYDQFALEAFEVEAVDYLLKPFSDSRFTEALERARRQVVARELDLTERIHRLIAKTKAREPWIRRVLIRKSGRVLFVPVDEIDFLRADEKYTLVGCRGDGARPGEALVRTPLKELASQLDPEQFAQVHRSVIVNLGSVDRVTRGPNETATIHLRGRPETLPVSRAYVQLFRQM